jgi:hypothetical protein
MATDKTFSVAGVSKLNGDYKIRFANDVMRVKNLAKSGHEDIRLVELADAMLKTDAAKFIATLDEFQDADAQTAIAEYLEKHDKQPKVKVEVKKAVKKAVATKPAKATKATKATAPAKTKAEVQAVLDQADDAPF